MRQGIEHKDQHVVFAGRQGNTTLRVHQSVLTVCGDDDLPLNEDSPAARVGGAQRDDLPRTRASLANGGIGLGIIGRTAVRVNTARDDRVRRRPAHAGTMRWHLIHQRRE
jgi:hypothetical protein